MSSAEYADLVARLQGTQRFGMRLGLERMTSCLDALDNPHRRIPVVIQIAGTNGKGSTSAFVESILRAAGIATALYTSPHLLRLSERFQVGGAELSAGELVEADRAVSAADARLGIDLTFFERLTAMAAVAFAARQVEVAVFEVGLGGRLDATSALGAEVAAVAGVALDHQEHLGDTLEAIAREKAGIFRPGQDAVIGIAGEPEAVPILIAEARAAGVARLSVLDDASVLAVPEPIGLLGPHQRRNAACALAVTGAFSSRGGRAIGEEARRTGLARCRLAGRLERLVDHPLVLADGAHNPHGARALAAALPGPLRWVAVLGASRDKDAAGLVAAIAGRVQAIVATASRHDRALPAGELAEVARRSVREVREAPDLATALAMARAIAGPDGGVVVAGSLFLVGEARQLLLGEPADPVPVFDPR